MAMAISGQMNQKYDKDAAVGLPVWLTDMHL